MLKGKDFVEYLVGKRHLPRTRNRATVKQVATFTLTKRAMLLKTQVTGPKDLQSPLPRLQYVGSVAKPNPVTLPERAILVNNDNIVHLSLVQFSRV